jgi:hypothetical protein
MPIIDYKKMRTIMPPLTNQELLTELERRIKEGSIKLEFDTSQVNQTNEASPKIFGLNKSTLMLGIVLAMGVLVFYSQSSKTLPVQLQTTVKINEK